jgi:predicted Co/Zn/Cd cation transporter (cation efflux family)
MPASQFDLERKSLGIGKWGNLFMAVVGVAAAFLSHSDALLVDGLYSGVNFFSAIIAAWVSASVARPADRAYPFGYNAHEALYVTFRSLVLLGIIIFAVFGAIGKIITYARGGEVPELVFGPILVYAIVMVVICFSLAAWHLRNWHRNGRRSDILKTESRAAMVDGIISGGAGGGLLAAGLLRGTQLGFIVPVADAVIVLVLCAFIIRQPVGMFLDSLGEVAGRSADRGTVELVGKGLRALLEERPFTLLEVLVTKLGRIHFVVSYVRPEGPVEGQAVDRLWGEQEACLHALLDQVKSEIVITDQPPFKGAD